MQPALRFFWDYVKRNFIVLLAYITAPLLVITIIFIYGDYTANADSIEMVHTEELSTTEKRSASLVGYHKVQQVDSVITVSTANTLNMAQGSSPAVTSSVTANSSANYRITKQHSEIVSILQNSQEYKNSADYYDRLYKAYLAVYPPNKYGMTPDEICLGIFSNNQAEGTPLKIEQKTITVTGKGYTIRLDGANGVYIKDSSGKEEKITGANNCIDSLEHWCLYAKAILSVSDPNSIKFGISTVQWTFGRNYEFTKWCYKNKLNGNTGNLNDMGAYAAEYTFMEQRMTDTLDIANQYVETNGILGITDCICDKYESPQASSEWSCYNGNRQFEVLGSNGGTYSEMYVIAQGKVLFDPAQPEIEIKCADGKNRKWANYTRSNNAYKLWNLIENNS